MEKDVVISIKGMQKYEGNDPDTVELVTAGRLMKDKAGYTLSYQESEITGLEGTLTTIQVEGEQVTLMRMGEFNSQMVFQEGRRHLSMYNTPYGAMSVGVNTRAPAGRPERQGGRHRDRLCHRDRPRHRRTQRVPDQGAGGRRCHPAAVKPLCVFAPLGRKRCVSLILIEKVII